MMKKSKNVVSLGFGLCALALVGFTTSVSANEEGSKIAPIEATFTQSVAATKLDTADLKVEMLNIESELKEGDVISFDYSGELTPSKESVKYMDAEHFEQKVGTSDADQDPTLTIGFTFDDASENANIKEENGKLYITRDEGKTWEEMNVVRMDKVSVE